MQYTRTSGTSFRHRSIDRLDVLDLKSSIFFALFCFQTTIFVASSTRTTHPLLLLVMSPFIPTLIRLSRPFKPVARHRSGRPILAPIAPTRARAAPLPLAPEIDVASLVIYEDAKVLVVDKPASFALQGMYGSIARIKYDSMLKALRTRFSKGNDDEPEMELFPVHRLDKGVSGVLVMSKSQRSARSMSKEFEMQRVKKEYVAVVQQPEKGFLKGDGGVVNARLRTREDRVERVQEGEEVFGNGKDATTLWSCLDSSATHALLLLKPSTGRKHQLRVHCAESLNAPIIGDFKYGPTADHRSFGGVPNDFILLHSFRIAFHTWSKDGKRNLIEASVDPSSAFAKYCIAAGLDMSLIRPAASTTDPLATIAPIGELKDQAPIGVEQQSIL